MNGPVVVAGRTGAGKTVRLASLAGLRPSGPAPGIEGAIETRIACDAARHDGKPRDDS